ncbi:hypothetical protein SAMN02910317_01820 [Ruminococcaceae bacterium FB2012]|nr:hypothetical protein SAMN02910317_01820 [Ruminococcaceae bacterium FB2012]
MAAQSSQKRIANYSRVLSKNCRKQSWLIIILCGLQTLMSVFQFVAFGRLGTDNNFYSFGSKFGLAAALAGVLIVPAVFKEVYNRQFADVEFSLPMSASERFRSKLLVLAKDHLLPFLIAQLVILTVALITVPSEQCALIVKDFLSNIINLLFTDGISLLCVSCCGCLAECIYTPLLSAAALSLILPLSYVKFFVLLAGRLDVPSGVSGFPIGYPFVNDLISNSDYYYQTSFFSSISIGMTVMMLVINMLFCAALILLAFRIYRKRNGLNVGKPMVFKAFYRVFVAVVSLAIILLFFLNSFYLSIFVGLLAFLGISVTTKRAKMKLRDLEFWLLGFVGCLFSVVAVGFVAYITGGFGHLKAPAAEIFNNDQTFIRVQMFAGKYEYDAETIADNEESIKYAKENGFDERAITSKAKTDEIIAETSDMDKRYNSSLFENLLDYICAIRFENYIQETIYDGSISGTVSVSVYIIQDDYSWCDERINFTVRTTKEAIGEYFEKLKERGLFTEIYNTETNKWSNET